jgi:hypothetical protein
VDLTATENVTTFWGTFFNSGGVALQLPDWDYNTATNMQWTFTGWGAMTVANPIQTRAITIATQHFKDCTIPTSDYSDYLIDTEANNQNSSVVFHGGDSTYNASGATARAALIADHSWTITDGGAA